MTFFPKEADVDVIKTLSLWISAFVTLYPLVFILSLVRFRPSKKSVFFPFRNLTGNQDYEGKISGFADIVTQEYLRAWHLREILDPTYEREHVEVMDRETSEPEWLSTAQYRARTRITFLKSSLGLSADPGWLKRGAPGSVPVRGILPKSSQVYSPEMELRQILEIKDVKLPLEHLYKFYFWIMGSERIHGNFQMHNSKLTITVYWDGKQNEDNGRNITSWQISSDTIPANNENTDRIFHKMAQHLAYMMIWNLSNTPENEPHCIQEWIDGLDHFWSFRCSNGLNIKASKDAENSFKKAIKYNPSFYLAYLYLGIIYEEQSKISEAIAQYEEAIEADQFQPEAHYRLGLAYHDRGLLQESLKEFETAVDLQSKFFEARYQLAHINKDVGDEHLFIASEYKSDKNSENKKAKKKYKEAVEQYLKFIKLCKDLIKKSSIEKGTYIHKIKIARAKGELGNAYAQLAILEKEQIYSQKSKNAFNEAIKIYQELKLIPKELKPSIEKCNKLVLRHKVATRKLSEDLWFKPINPPLRDIGNLLTYCCERKLKLNDWKKDDNIRSDIAIKLKVSIEAFKILLKTDPMNWEIWNQLALVYKMKGELAADCKFKDNKSKIYKCPEDSQKEFGKAISCYGKAISLNPLNCSIYSKLGQVYDKMEAKPEADSYHEIARKIWESEGNSQTALNILAGSQESIIERICSLTKGWLYLQQNDFNKGRKCLFTYLFRKFNWHEIKEFEKEFKEFLKQNYDIGWVENATLIEKQSIITLIKGKDSLSLQLKKEKNIVELKINDKITDIKVIEENNKLQICMKLKKDINEIELLHLELGILFISEKDWDIAFKEKEAFDDMEKKWEEIIGQSPRYLLDFADAYCSIMEYEEARKLCNKVIQLNEKDPYIKAEALATRGQVYLSSKKYPEAIRDCQEATKLLPMYDFPYYIKGFAHLGVQEYELAIRAWMNIVKELKSQLLANAYHQIANAYYSISKVDAKNRKDFQDKAEDAYRLSIMAFDDRDLQFKALAHADRAQVLVDLKRQEEANLECKKAIGLVDSMPENRKVKGLTPDFHIRLAMVFANCKNLESAKGEYYKAIKICDSEIERNNTAKERPKLINKYKEIKAMAMNNLAYDIYAREGIASMYLFIWNEIPGNDSVRFIDFLKQNYGINWVKKENIEKTDDGRTIRASVEKNYLSLSLNDDKTKVNFEVSDGRTDEYIADTMNGKLRMYAYMDISEGLKLVRDSIDIVNKLKEENEEEKEKFNMRLKDYYDTKAWLFYKNGEYYRSASRDNEAIKYYDLAEETLIEARSLAMLDQVENYHLALIYERKEAISKDINTRKKYREQSRYFWKNVHNIDAYSELGKKAAKRLKNIINEDF